MPVYNYTTLDDPSADNETTASGINAAGQIVGWYHSSTVGYETFANGINDVGQIGGLFVGSNSHSFLYNPNGGTYTSVDALASDTEALGINDAGQIVGDYIDNAGTTHGRGFQRNNGLLADEARGGRRAWMRTARP
jgi:uncharacterized membrane protein